MDAVGIAAFIATLAFVRRTHDLERYRYTFAAVGLLLLVLPLFPVVGRTINGSRIWVSFGPVNFQPGEAAKIVLALFFAGYLVKRRELLALSTWRLGPLHFPDPKYLGPIGLAWGVSLVVMTAKKDLGSSLLFFFLFVVMLWVATARTTYLSVGVSLFALGSFFAYTQFSHVADRVHVWLNPWPQAKGNGFQVVEALIAFADGGLAGTGIGLGTPTRIPEVETDFIFAAIGEELGLLGAPRSCAPTSSWWAPGCASRSGPTPPSTRSWPSASPPCSACRPSSSSVASRGAPAYRRDPALRQLRRLEPRPQLRAAGPAAAHLRQLGEGAHHAGRRARSPMSQPDEPSPMSPAR